MVSKNNVISADLKNVGQCHHLQISLYLGYHTADFNPTLTKMMLLDLTKKRHISWPRKCRSRSHFIKSNISDVNKPIWTKFSSRMMTPIPDLSPLSANPNLFTPDNSFLYMDVPHKSAIILRLTDHSYGWSAKQIQVVHDFSHFPHLFLNGWSIESCKRLETVAKFQRILNPTWENQYRFIFTRKFCFLFQLFQVECKIHIVRSLERKSIRELFCGLRRARWILRHPAPKYSL